MTTATGRSDRQVLKAPFPYAGGKSRVADLVWARIGDVDNFIEPFAGTIAVTLRRPAEHFRNGYRVETVNDTNHYLVNFWRAVANDPEKVAKYADWPVAEADLHARHKWLVRSKEAAEWIERMRTDPEHFDAKIAGWWVWGQCCWIGGGWCQDDSRNITPETRARPNLRPGSEGGVHGGRPQLTDAFDIGRGVNSGGNRISKQVPDLSGDSGAFGRGVHASAAGGKRPNFSFNNLGAGVCSNGPDPSSCDHNKRPVFPDFGGVQRGVAGCRREWLTDWMQRLSDRLRLVRTCYGHWSRICDSESTLTRLGSTGVFLDPPYPSERGDTGEKSRDDSLYMNDRTQDLNALRDEVLDWCQRHGPNPMIRVAVCGYEGDGYEVLAKDDAWLEESWEASGGYGNQRRAGKKKSQNAKRERIWFSPACKKPAASLFDAA